MTIHDSQLPPCPYCGADALDIIRFECGSYWEMADPRSWVEPDCQEPEPPSDEHACNGHTGSGDDCPGCDTCRGDGVLG